MTKPAISIHDIDFHLTAKQERMLNVLSDPAHAKKTNEEKAKIAGITSEYLYKLLRNPNFVQAVRVRGLSTAITYTMPMIKRMANDGLAGRYMPGRTILEMAGMVASPQQAPLINVILNSNPIPQEDLDNSLMEKMKSFIDIEPVDKPVDNSISDGEVLNASVDKPVNSDNTI